MGIKKYCIGDIGRLKKAKIIQQGIVFGRKHKFSLLLIIILFLAFFLRFWQLNRIPPGLYPDVAINGNDAWEALRTGSFKVFYPANNGREGLFINLIAFSFYLLGHSIWAIKVVPALLGFLTVLGIYLLTKELFDKKIALISTFFLAVCFWHLNFSRLGFRAIMLPFVLVFSFYFLFRGLRTRRFLNFILGGLFFGLGLHTYISWRLAPLILIIWVGIYCITEKKFFFDYWSRLLVFILSALVSAFPLLFYFYKHPADFMDRASDVSVFRQPRFLQLIFLNTLKALGMFNIFGDANWRHNLSGAPMFTFLLGLFFAGGLILAIIKIIRNKNSTQRFILFFLLLWFIVMLLPTILSAEGIPHALRALGVLPACLILAAYFLDWFFQLKFWQKISANRKMIVLFILLITIGLAETTRYFIIWGRNPEVYAAFNQNFVNMGNYLNSLPFGTVKYVVANEPGVLVNGLPMPVQTVKFITWEKSYPRYILPEDLLKINFSSSPTAIVLMKKDDILLNALSKKFKNGRIEKIDLIPGTKSEFFVFKID